MHEYKLRGCGTLCGTLCDPWQGSVDVPLLAEPIVDRSAFGYPRECVCKYANTYQGSVDVPLLAELKLILDHGAALGLDHVIVVDDVVQFHADPFWEEVGVACGCQMGMGGWVERGRGATRAWLVPMPPKLIR